jgi:hypothetical protein
MGKHVVIPVFIQKLRILYSFLAAAHFLFLQAMTGLCAKQKRLQTACSLFCFVSARRGWNQTATIGTLLQQFQIQKKQEKYGKVWAL